MSLPNSLINWYGGKQKLARQIISIMPEHQHYVEVFMGGGAVFFNKSKSRLNTINDFNHHLVNLYIQVRDNHEVLMEKCYWTLRSREEYRKFYRLYQNDFAGVDDVTRAMMYLFLVQSSFSTQLKAGYSASVTANSATFNLTLLKKIKSAREKLDEVVIECMSFEKLIKKYDREDAEVLFYLDPPYYITALKATKYYEKIMSVFQHEMLASVLHTCKSPWILSYDDVPEILNLYRDFSILRVTAKYAHGREQIRKVNELLICNFTPKKPQLDIFDEAGVEVEDISDSEIESAVEEIKLKREVELESQQQEKYVTKSNCEPGVQQSLFN